MRRPLPLPARIALGIGLLIVVVLAFARHSEDRVEAQVERRTVVLGPHDGSTWNPARVELANELGTMRRAAGFCDIELSEVAMDDYVDRHAGPEERLFRQQANGAWASGLDVDMDAFQADRRGWCDDARSSIESAGILAE